MIRTPNGMIGETEVLRLFEQTGFEWDQSIPLQVQHSVAVRVLMLIVMVIVMMIVMVLVVVMVMMMVMLLQCSSRLALSETKASLSR
jgi:heme/copper-type cytochrome/quinol oxidase subunit 2